MSKIRNKSSPIKNDLRWWHRIWFVFKAYEGKTFTNNLVHKKKNLLRRLRRTAALHYVLHTPGHLLKSIQILRHTPSLSWNWTCPQALPPVSHTAALAFSASNLLSYLVYVLYSLGTAATVVPVVSSTLACHCTAVCSGCLLYSIAMYLWSLWNWSLWNCGVVLWPQSFYISSDKIRPCGTLCIPGQVCL